jgi:hypothetical protein
MRGMTMSKQYHFVVMYDTETKQFEIDYETMSSQFDDGIVYDTSTGEWEILADNEYDEDSGYTVSGNRLFEALETLNERNGNENN